MTPRTALYRIVAALVLLSAVLCPPPSGGAALAQAAPEPFSTTWELHRMGAPAEDGSVDLVAVLWLTLEDGYHAYANPPGETGLPTTLRLTRQGTDTPPPVLYPPGEEEPDVFDPTLTVNTYYGTVPLFVSLTAVEGEPLALSGTLSLAACSDDNCWPLRAPVEFAHDGDYAALPDGRRAFWHPLYAAIADDPGSSLTAAPAAEPAETSAQADGWDFTPRYHNADLEVQGLGLALVFAFIAGFILNFMPCVLPVVSLKLSALMAGAGEEADAERTRAFREHNLFFSVGVMGYFLLLGGVVAALGLAWGQLFQNQYIVLGLTLVVFALALSLFGLYTLPIVDLKADGAGRSPKVQAVFTGVLATLLATPCSGPFLGGVLGWVLLQPPETILAVFLAIGLGMSAPFLLMTARPGLVRFLPKPGPWMRYLERGVGFFLMGTCLYLLAILPADMLLPALSLLLVTAFAAWMWGGWTNLTHSTLRRTLTRGAAVALVAAAWFLLLSPGAPRAAWEEFDEAAFRAALGREPIVVDFTADWCPNCKLLEHTTLSPDNLGDWQREWGVRLMQVDLTRENPALLAFLRSLGSQSIPVVAIFPPGKDSARPLVLRDMFTAAQMDEALADALPRPDADEGDEG